MGVCVALLLSVSRKLYHIQDVVCFMASYYHTSADGEIRRTLFLGVLRCPPSGLSSSFTFIYVHGCSLMVSGVPVNIPVKLSKFLSFDSTEYLLSSLFDGLN